MSLMIKDDPKFKTPYNIRLANKRSRDKNKVNIQLKRIQKEVDNPDIRMARLATTKKYRDNHKIDSASTRAIWELNNEDKVKSYKNRWYINNIDKQNGLRTKRRKEIREFVNSLKENKPCIKCNIIFDPVCMDFHHRDPTQKDLMVSICQRMCWTNETILEEVAKCDIMCANCHRLEHKCI